MKLFGILNFLAIILAIVNAKPKINSEVVAEPDLSLVKFVFYSEEVPDGQEIDIEFVELPPSYDPSKTTFVLIHGWNSDIDFAASFVDDLLQRTDCNIFGVDWSEAESWTNYFAAAQTSVEVGDYAGDFLSKLVLLGLDADNIHIIGHSLGAHSAGHAARKVEAISGFKVARISGLEPAKPYFDIADPSLSLNKKDAKFLDVMHTNSGELYNGCLSFPEPLGHVDFYPAGGVHQPGCTEICVLGCTESDLIDLMKGGCSHGRSHEYFIESINSPIPFTSTACSDWDSYLNGDCSEGNTELMGYDCSTDAIQGSYYLNVNEEAPFAQG